MKKNPAQLKERFDMLKTRRVNFEVLWQELTDYIIPRKNDIIIDRFPGEKRNFQVFDNTAIQANQLLAGALHGLLTNPAAQWFVLTTGIEQLDNRDDVRKYLQDTSVILHNIMNNSNFQTEAHENYLDLGSIGTAGLSIVEDPDMVVRFKAMHIAELYIAENNKGFVDEVHRAFKWDATKIISQFGSERVHKDVLKAWKSNSSKEFEMVHAVYPRHQDPDEEKDPGSLPIVSQFILPEYEFELLEEGFNEQPIIVPRWAKSAGEEYGRSPGMNALPDIRTLNEMTRVTIVGAQKTIDPPIQMPDDGFVLPIVSTPGGINYFRSGSTDRIEPLFNDSRIDFGFQAMSEKRNRVRESFFVDQLQLTTGPQMTAAEVAQRTEERLTLLGPLLARQRPEYLKPVVDRVFGIANRRKLLPEAPAVLKGRNIDVRYSSAIAQVQRAREVQNVLRTMEAVTPFINLNPAVADNFNGDEAVRVVAKLLNFPQRAINNREKVAATRQARAEAEAKAIQAQQDAATAKETQQVGAGVKSAAEAQAVQGA